MFLRRSTLFVCLSVIVALTALRAQAPSIAPSINGQEIIPFDAAVRTATLPNGIRYYIRENQRPANRVSLRLADKIPDGVIKVAESGITTAADVRQLRAAGYNSFLVGEHLMKSGDPARALQTLLS